MPLPTARDVHIDTAMSAISIAYRNTELIAESIFPGVPVQKMSDKYYVFGRGAWFRDSSKQRAPGTRAVRVGFDTSSASYMCIEYALAHGIPDEVRENADAPLKPDIDATELITDLLLLGQEIRIATIIEASANWGNSGSVSTQWSDDTSDPLGDIETARNAIIQKIGRKPNVLTMGQDVWTQLKNHPDLLDRIKYTQKGVLSVDLAAGLFEVDKLLVGTSIKNTAQEGVTDSMTYVWGKNAWLGYVAPTPSLKTPSAGYLLTWKTRQAFRYREDQEHQDVFEVRLSTAEVVSASDAGYLYMSAVA